MKKLFIVLLLAMATHCISYSQDYYIGKGDTVCLDTSSTETIYDSSITLLSSGEIIFNDIKSSGKMGTISNISNLFNTFNVKKPQRGQYEKTELFNKRFDAYRAKYKNKYYVNVDVDKTYDADNDRIKLMLKYSNNYLNIKHTSQYLNSSVGQNAFGVKVKYLSYKDTYYNINANGPSELILNGSDNVSNVITAMYNTFWLANIKPKKAKQIIPYLGIAYELENIIDTETFEDVEEATIDNPLETKRIDKILYSKIRAIYLYNKATKDVLRRVYFK